MGPSRIIALSLPEPRFLSRLPNPELQWAAHESITRVKLITPHSIGVHQLIG